MTLPSFEPDFSTPSAWAYMYRAVGLQLVPCKRPSDVNPGDAWKRPHLADWVQFQQELAPDAVFSSWYDQHSGSHHDRFNMGLITGTVSGRVMVLDLDIHKKPAAGQWWQALLEVHNSGLDLETVEQVTGGGGRQKLFRYPEGWKAPTNRTDLGVDIRGEGGFAVLPPSLHESGKEYTWLPGRAPWEVEIEVAPQWLLEEIETLVDAYPGAQAGPKPERTASPAGDVNAFHQTVDGRETKMRDVVWRHVLELYRTCPIPPTETEILAYGAEAYLDYEVDTQTRLTDVGSRREGLEKEGRGPTAFMAKWRREIRHWGSPKMVEHARRPNPHAKEEDLAAEFETGQQRGEQKAKADPGLQYDLLDMRQIMATADPAWLIEEMVIEKALGFIFGPPASLKTFIALDMALSLACHLTAFWGKKVGRTGAVIYISSEGLGSLKFRLQAWQQHHKTVALDAPFYLIKENINFMKGEDVGKLLATVQAAKDRAGCEIAAVFVDTVSRVLPGAEENQQKDMTLFVYACDQLRERFGATVIGIHHTNKGGTFRGSSVMPAAGDFVLEIRREPGAMTGSMYAEKIKDAVDGWERPFKVTEVPIGGIVPRTSLVIEQDDRTPAGAAGLPPKEVLRRVLIAITEAWNIGKPWSAQPQSPDRYMPRMMWTRFEIPAKQGRHLMEQWLMNDVLSIEMVNTDTRMKGLKVVGSID